MRERQSGELSFSDPFSSDYKFKGFLSFRDTKRTFPEASGVPRLSLELEQVLKADPAAVWMQQQSWAWLWYPLSQGGQGVLGCREAASPSVTHRIAAMLLCLSHPASGETNPCLQSYPFIAFLLALKLIFN